MSKLAIVVDASLNLPPGKLAAQSVHAATAALRQNKNTKWLNAWKSDGEPVIVLSIETCQDLQELYTQTIDFGIPCAVVHDAGKTVVTPNTLTCIGIGPAPSLLIDTMTRHLKLYK